MKKALLLIYILTTCLTTEARKWTVEEVKDIINKVNTYWQTNNSAEVRAFWDNAAYHTGNMEVYKLLKDTTMLDYSIRWATHNQWMGAKEPDPTKWKYKQYGEGQDYVLFGDWQICFQTYIDLYHLSPDGQKVERAMEVMGYEADSKANDYWWWADALYMVMPVMTKMYKLTGDTKYLRKLYENILYSDSIMLDKETGLYFRDGKYVWPKHKTDAGKKDFWARGDGWVLAGLAKVLQDMPKTYEHQAFFTEKFVNLARGVKPLQQPEGYWTRSMMDPEQAPGPETSGTAFFCYGLLWGVNNGYLSKAEFAPTIKKAWDYLTQTALQKDGKIGYVQPIGERAIPRQKVDANSQANFGVGAFLLAACEYTRYLQQEALHLLPRANDTFWRDSIPIEMRQSYIHYGESYLGKPWRVLPWTVFAEYKTNGNRVNYETLCFEKRRQFAAIVMAEIMEGRGRFLNDIIDGIGSFCEETWWGIPAHYDKSVPLSEVQEVDLFNAETASLIAWTRYMLQPQLDALSPTLCQRIDREIEHRILKPALAKNYWWKKAGMNWNPWICSNWLACVLICEEDEARKAEAIAQITKATQTFIDAYPEDGGCDEGPGYWDRAAASMFEVIRLLSDYSEYSDYSDFSDYSEKIRNMAAYAYKTYIGNGYCVNFADAHDNKAVQQVNIVYPFGLYLNDKTMRAFGAYIGQQKDVLNNPALLYDRSGNFPTLGRELFFLRHIQTYMKEQPREPLLNNVWLPDLQIMTARRGNLYVAMKGGNNGESHNHNDVGSFIVYADNQPLLIDPGVGEYTAATFGKNRYDIWTMQSQYHNLPQINGYDQKDGQQYAAKVIPNKILGRLCLDIAGAYPKEAGINTWRRTVSAMKSGISVTEDYELDHIAQPSRLQFLTIIKPSQSVRHAVRLGSHTIDFDANQLEVSVEDISDKLDPLLQNIWGPQMYRIIFTIRSPKTKHKISYTIR